MPGKKKKSKKNNLRLPETVRPYHGPLVLRDEAARNQRVRCAFAGALTSSAAGIISISQGVYTNTLSSGTGGSSITGSSIFASYAARYGEYRILSLRVTYQPRVKIQDATYGPGNIAMAVTRGTNTLAAATLNGVYSGSNVKVVSIFDRFEQSIRGQETAEMEYTTSGTANNWGAVIISANGLSNSTVYGDLLLDWVAEFRSLII